VTVEIIHEHSVRTDLLSKLPVLDAGCLGFGFGFELAKRGHPVVFLDPAPDIEPPVNTFDLPLWASFSRTALVGRGYPPRMRLRMTHDRQARHLTHASYEGDPLVDTITLPALMASLHIEQWDVLKLDIEGAEYDVLMAIDGPIARQISVEFHEHCFPRGDAAIARVVEHLGQWYVPVRHEKDKRHCLPENWWDSLFVLRELA